MSVSPTEYKSGVEDTETDSETFSSLDNDTGRRWLVVTLFLQPDTKLESDIKYERYQSNASIRPSVRLQTQEKKKSATATFYKQALTLCLVMLCLFTSFRTSQRYTYIKLQLLNSKKIKDLNKKSV